MRKLLEYLRSTNALRRTLGFGSVFSAIKFDYHIQYLAKVDFKRALVLAPHPDDDVFGLGGTIKKMTTAGSTVTVAYFTDGAFGTPVSLEDIKAGVHSTVFDKDLIEKRKQEAKHSGEILGISESIFWGYRDSKLAASHSAKIALEDLISKLKPDIIFLPSFLDDHPDHRVTNEIFLNATSSLKPEDSQFEIWAYEIWTPILINRLVDISLYIKTKEEAIKAHQSQLESRRYDKAITALNQYRAEVNNIQGYAEGFFACDLKLYKELYDKS